MIDIAQQQAARRAVHDQPNVSARAHRPEVLIAGTVELVEAHT